MTLPLEGDLGDASRAAVLFQQLPAGSRVARLQVPELAWDAQSYLLWHIEYQLRCLVWSLSYDKKRPAPKPQPLRTPAQLADAHRKRDAALSAKEEIDRKLGFSGGGENA